MREIKFKYYWQHCDTGNIVSGVFTISDCEDGRLKFYAGHTLGKRYGYHIGRCEYTGLKDKNGKEIYEGDVLLNENGQLYTVEFFNGSFNVIHKNRKLSDIYTLWEYINNISLCEIIGNIYENKDLLT